LEKTVDKKTSIGIMIIGIIGLFFLFILGNVPAVKAEDAKSVEGVWDVQSSWDGIQGGRYTIVRKDEGYAVSADGKDLGIFYGSPTQIMSITTPSYDVLRRLFRRAATDEAALSALGQLAGKVTKRDRITVSSDGLSAVYAEDKINVSYDSTGRLVDYGIDPFVNLTTLSRVASAKVESPVVNTNDAQLAAAIKAYNEKCGGQLEPNSTLAVQCQQEAQFLQNQIANSKK